MAGETDTLLKAYKLRADVAAAEAQQLSSAAEWAAKLLAVVTTPKASAAGLMPTAQSAVMPVGLLNKAHGLAFIRCTKVGLGLSVASGDGFVVRQLFKQTRTSNEIPVWSAPIFFKVSQAGIGLTAGYETIESVIALMDDDVVNHFAASHTIAGADGALLSSNTAMTGVPAGTLGTSTTLEVGSDDTGVDCKTFCYSYSNGALLNVSINGTNVSPDDQHNARLYGEGADLKAVLASEQGTFKELLPLYRQIHALAPKVVCA